MVTQRARPGYKSLTDSLAQEITALRNQNDSLLLLLNDEMSKANLLDTELKDKTEANENLKSELVLSKGNQLQTSHTSSILLIFNVIVAVILLIAIFWFYMRRKNPGSDEEETEVRTVSAAVKDNVETRMDRIEKLGRLRDKGLLTEEEFQLQKKQILD
ncbi:MAG: SHOCT domain-containing protein [Bacteroidota bacterium]